MNKLLSRTVWDYILGGLVAASSAVVTLVFVGFALQASSRFGYPHPWLRNALLELGFIVVLAVLLVVTFYEVVLRLRARGKMLEPGTTESRILSREVIVRALLSGAAVGVYMVVVTIIFIQLAYEAADLNLFVVLLLGLLPTLMLIAAGALAYAYVGPSLIDQQRSLNNQERITLLALPLVLAVTFGFLFGAAAGNAAGIVNAFVAAVLTYVLIRGLARLRWRVIRRTLENLLQARGGPTIRVVATHRA